MRPLWDGGGYAKREQADIGLSINSSSVVTHVRRGIISLTAYASGVRAPARETGRICANPCNIVSDLWPGEDRPTRYSSHDESATTFIGCARPRPVASRFGFLIAEIGWVHVGSRRIYRLTVSEHSYELWFNIVKTVDIILGQIFCIFDTIFYTCSM